MVIADIYLYIFICICKVILLYWQSIVLSNFSCFLLCFYIDWIILVDLLHLIIFIFVFCMKKTDLAWVFDTLWVLYPDATTELHYSTPFQLLIAVIMSAQATDKQVNKVTLGLFQQIKSPQDVLNMGYDAYEQAIKSIWLYRSKAKNIWKLCNLLLSDSYIESLQDQLIDPLVNDLYKKYGYIIPRRIVDLMQLPGVWEKTAKVVAHVLYKDAVIAVDTHVHRVCNRLGIVTTKEPLQTSKLLETVIPDHYKTIAHHCLILFGRYHCVARKPKCETCPVSKVCLYYKKLKKTTKL